MNDKLRVEKKIAITILSIIVGILAIFLIYDNVYTVDTGEVAIISKFGKVKSVEYPGLHMKIPFIETKHYIETRERTYLFTKNNENGINAALEVSTKDLQTILVEFTVQASVSDPLKLFTAFKGDEEIRFIRPRVKEIVQATISKYTIEEFISKRQEISQRIFANLKEDFAKYGINVSNISIVNHDFSDEYEKAIENKKIAEQAVETARAQQEKLRVEAENKVKLAEYALRQKELEAKANSIISNSLTPQLLKKMEIEKWDGHLPKVQGSSGTIIGTDILK